VELTMFDRIKARWIPSDDTKRIRAQYLGVLSEALASKRLALAGATDPAEKLELRCAIAGIEAALKLARQAKGDKS